MLTARCNIYGSVPGEGTLICQKRVEPVRFRLAAQGLLIRYLLYTLFAPDGISPAGDCESPFPARVVRLELGPEYILER